MRIVLAALTVAVTSFAAQPAQADPYRFCAEVGAGVDGGLTDCSFWTWEQCQDQIRGLGGFCRANQFYDGQPIRTPGEQPVRRSKKPRS